MLGDVLVKQIEETCKSLGTNRRSIFDPRPINKALTLTPQAKTRQARNITMFLNSSKYKTLMKQLQKEFDIALTK